MSGTDWSNVGLLQSSPGLQIPTYIQWRVQETLILILRK